MPRAKDPSYYPSAYAEFIRRAIAGEASVVPVESETQGRKLRGQFYAYTGSLREYQKKQLIGGKEDSLCELAQLSWQVTVSLEVDKAGQWTATWAHRDASWQAQLLAKAQTKGAAAPTIAPGAGLMALIEKPEA